MAMGLASLEAIILLFSFFRSLTLGRYLSNALFSFFHSLTLGRCLSNAQFFIKLEQHRTHENRPYLRPL